MIEKNCRVGSQIKDYLKNNGITQTFVAKKTGMRFAYLSEKLNGRSKMSVEDYFKICDALEVPLNTFAKNYEAT